MFVAELVRESSHAPLATDVDTFDFGECICRMIVIVHCIVAALQVLEQQPTPEPNHEAIVKIFQLHPFDFSTIATSVSLEPTEIVSIRINNLNVLSNQTKVYVQKIVQSW